MESVIRSLLLSFMFGTGYAVLYETMVPRREMRYRWISYTMLPAFTAGFILISFTRIPHYIFQPLRLIIVTAVIAQFYFRISIVKNLVLSVTFCGIYWIESYLLALLLYLFPFTDYAAINENVEAITISLHLCLVMLIRHKLKKRFHGLAGAKWEKFGFFPLIGMIVIMAICMMPIGKSTMESYARLIAVSGFAVINICVYFFVANMIEKEAEVQNLRLLQERMQNQMDMYQHMKKNYEWQRRSLHDYKNQLNCIQGMLNDDRIEETKEYIAGLTGSFQANITHINTNHAVVNVVLNQKYQEATEKGIAMTMSVNDLSALTVSEEEIVSLLVNLLDNAIEACERLEENRVIQFKMILEEGQLILSVRNPVKETVQIKGKTIVTSKQDKSHHGIGLLNIDSVVSRNDGTSVLKCENGWFSFSVMIPA